MDNFDKNLDEHFKNVSRNVNRGFKAILVFQAFIGLGVLGLIGTGIYLLLKNFG